jgi:hypothetical protein
LKSTAALLSLALLAATLTTPAAAAVYPLSNVVI